MRLFAKVIRSRRYGQVKEPFMYHREQIMLFHPWRDEEREVNQNSLATYTTNIETIQRKAGEYNKMMNGTNIEDILYELEEQEAAREDVIEDE